jgi:hypothetical protein
MKDKIFEVAKNHTENEETAMQLTNELCVLLGVSKQRELFICSDCKSDQTYLSEGGYVRTCLQCDKTARVNQ